MELHMGCSVGNILNIDGLVLQGGVLSIVLYVRGNSAHRKFMKEMQAADRLAGKRLPTDK